MMKFLLIPFFLVFANVFLLAQSPTLNKHFTINKLKTTCKIWGLLKYYSPIIYNSDTVDWDKEILNRYLNFKNAKNIEEFNT